MTFFLLGAAGVFCVCVYSGGEQNRRLIGKSAIVCHALKESV